jgi:hypothetical protein
MPCGKNNAGGDDEVPARINDLVEPCKLGEGKGTSAYNIARILTTEVR